jgi:hypothetical protein
MPASGVNRTRMKTKDGRLVEMKIPLGGGSFGRPLRCSSVTAPCGDGPSGLAPLLMRRGRPKSLAAPSAPIYEMASMEQPGGKTPASALPCGFDKWRQLAGGANSKCKTTSVGPPNSKLNNERKLNSLWGSAWCFDNQPQAKAGVLARGGLLRLADGPPRLDDK